MLFANTSYSTRKYLAVVKLVIAPRREKLNSIKFTKTKLKPKLKLAVKKVIITRANSNISSTTFYFARIYLYTCLFSRKLYSACLLGLYYIVYTTSI